MKWRRRTRSDAIRSAVKAEEAPNREEAYSATVEAEVGLSSAILGRMGAAVIAGKLREQCELNHFGLLIRRALAR